MNTIILLNYDFKKIIFQMNNKKYRKNKNDYYKHQNQLIPKKKVIITYDYRDKIKKMFDDNFPTIVFYLFYLLGNEFGKNLAKNIFINK